jgi:hypothetical protein
MAEDNENSEEFLDALNYFNYESNEYKEYKVSILGTVSRKDCKCSFYHFSDSINIDKIKAFSKIKTYSMNYQLNNNHIEKIIRQIEDANELYFVNPIAVIEYTNHYTDNKQNLIEIIDGHHRIKVLRKILKKHPNMKINFWVQTYKAPKPNSIEAITIFNQYNNTKPFNIILDLLDFKLLLVAKLNGEFNKNDNNFAVIRDSNSAVYRPYIKQKDFCDELEKRIITQIEVTRKDLVSDNVDKIFNNFITYNKTLFDKDDKYFNDKTNSSYSGKPISEKQYETAKANKCMLGLVKLDFLISHCVSL